MAVSVLRTGAGPEKLLRIVGLGASAIVLETGIAMPMASERAPLRYDLSELVCGWASCRMGSFWRGLNFSAVLAAGRPWSSFRISLIVS